MVCSAMPSEIGGGEAASLKFLVLWPVGQLSQLHRDSIRLKELTTPNASSLPFWDQTPEFDQNSTLFYRSAV
jgi:hypothetical protein